jgi:hypothetical protein
MALPWDNHVAENTFATAEKACEAADALYAMGLGGGRWDVRRWGWQRPAAAHSGSKTPGQPDPSPRRTAG